MIDPGALPPSLRRPRVAQTAWWAFDPNGMMRVCRRRFGDTFTLRLLRSGPLVMFADPDDVKQVLAGRRAVLHAGAANKGVLPMLGDHSVLTLDGEAHRRERKLLMPPLHGERMRAYGDIVKAATQRAVNDWVPGETVQVAPALSQISLEVIAAAVFGLSPDAARPAVELLRRFIGSYGAAMTFFPPLRRDLGPWSPGGRYRRIVQQMDDLVRDQIARRRRGGPGEDILSLLLAARDEEGRGMTDSQLRDELITLLLAGHETTAIALTWALRWILREPRVLARLHAELAACPARPEAWAKLPYLAAVCSEVLRIEPVLPGVARLLKGPFEVRGRTYPRGCLVGCAITLVHHDPALYPEPDRFRPERFLERRYASHEYLPFGGGTRRCIGEAFALYEMKIALAELLRERRFVLVDDALPVPRRRNLTMAPRGGAVVRVL